MSGKGRMISSMVIFGTIGVFVRYLPFASSVIALVRGVVGTLFLIAIGLISGNQVSGTAILISAPSERKADRKKTCLCGGGTCRNGLYIRRP